MAIFRNPVSDLASQISQRGGLARSNMFAVTFTGPASINPNPYLVNALCESVTLPGRAISTIEHGTIRQATKRPYTFINDDVTLTFLVTNDFYMKNIFDKWMKHVVDDEKGVVYYKNQYVSDMTITVLDLRSKFIYKCTLQNAYPITMNAVELSNANENGLIRLSVTLTYDNYVTRSTYFSIKTALADLKAAIAIPNPFMPGLPFMPFGDISNQLATLAAVGEGEFAGELNDILGGVTDEIRNKINEGLVAISKPYEGSLGSVVDQISGEVRNIFGGNGLSGGFGEAVGAIGSAVSDFAGAAGDFASSAVQAGSTIIDRASSGIKSLFG